MNSELSSASHFSHARASTRASTLLDIAILASIPLIQALINDAWLFTPAGWLDSWYFLGYGLNYTDPTFLNDYYKISRLPWVLVEFAVRSALPAIAASWVLQLGTLALGSSSLYFLLRRTLGGTAASIGVAEGCPQLLELMIDNLCV